MKTILVLTIALASSMAKAEFNSKGALLKEINHQSSGVKLGKGCPGGLHPWQVVCKNSTFYNFTTNNRNQVATIAIASCAGGIKDIAAVYMSICMAD